MSPISFVLCADVLDQIAVRDQPDRCLQPERPSAVFGIVEGEFDIEVTEIRRYNSWLKSAWGIESSTSINKAVPIMKLSELDALQRKHISDICVQDLQLYERITTHMDKRADCRVYGSDLE